MYDVRHIGLPTICKQIGNGKITKINWKLKLGDFLTKIKNRNGQLTVLVKHACTMFIFLLTQM